MNKTHFLHALYAAAMQLPFLVAGHAWVGAAFAIGWFISREHAHRQVDIRSETYEQVPNQNPFMGFLGWSKDAYLDVLFPIVVCVTLGVNYG